MTDLAITPEAIYKMRALPKATTPTDAWYAALDRTRTHAVLDAVDIGGGRWRLTVHATLTSAPSGSTTATVPLDVDAATHARLTPGPAGPLKTRRRVDREIIANEHLWPRWPRLWLTRDQGQLSNLFVLDGTPARQRIIDQGWIRASSLSRQGKDENDTTGGGPGKGRIRVERSTSKAVRPLDYENVNALLADGWEVAERQ